MLTKYSIKKPYTVIVMIIIVLIVGTVAVFSMPIDLLPNMEIPIMVVATIAPGQSPEGVERDITSPLEGGLRQVNNVTKVNSISSENMSIIILQFSDKVDLTTATLDIQAKIKEVSPKFPSLTMEPMVMKIDPNNSAVMNVAVSQQGKSLTESSVYLKEITDKLKSSTGVASVSMSGGVDNMVALQLDLDHFADNLVGKIASVMMQGDSPKAIKDLITELGKIFLPKKDKGNDTERKLPLPDISEMLGGVIGQLTAVVNPKIIETALSAHDFQMPAGQVTVGGVGYFVKVGKEVNTIVELQALQLMSMKLSSALPNIAGMSSSAAAEAKEFIYYNGKDLFLGKKMFDKALDIGIDMTVLGVVQKIGEGESVEYKFTAEVAGWFEALPAQSITMNDLAVTMELDNSSSMHTMINGTPGVILSVMKQPGFSTVDVTKGVMSSLGGMKKLDPSLDYIVLYDQGGDINFMLSTIISNLLFGALFAVVILLLFLKDIRPTIAVGCSIVVSVMGALGLMYLCGVTLNLISMGGLALAVGMLVDNSIVVIENIYRKRREGMSAIKASYEGARQVSGAIISSTITTVIVFLPVIFVNGLVKQIFVDLALTIAFSLGASLLVALTLVPAMASRMLKKDPKPEYKFFEKVKKSYARSLNFMLNKKWITIITVLVLFGVSVTGVFFMNKELFPSVASDNFSIGINVDKGKIDDGKLTYDETISDVVEDLYRIIKKNPNVENVGVELSSGTSYAGVSLGGGQVIAYVDLKPKYKGKPKAIKAEIERAMKETRPFVNGLCTVSTASSSLTSMLGDTSSLSINVKGNSLNEMKLAADELAEKLREQNLGTVTTGLEKPPMEYQLVVDRDKANGYGLMPAHIFLALSEVLTQPSSNMTVKFDSNDQQSKVYVYGFDYELVTWYRLIDPRTNQEARAYLDLKTGGNIGYYVLDDAGIRRYLSQINGEFWMDNTADGNLHFKKKSNKLYYEPRRTDPLDLVTHKLKFGTILANPAYSMMFTEEQREVLNKGVEVYKLLNLYDSCELDKNGSIIYREGGENIPKAIAMKEGLSSINHEEGKRLFTVNIKLNDGVNMNKAKHAVEKILDKYDAPIGVSVEFKGEDEMVTMVFESLYLILGLAIALIYLVMVAQFQSLKSPFIIMFTLPLAFTGSILLLWACGMSLSVFAIVGLIVLVGLVVNNGIVYVDYVNKLMLSGMKKREALLKTAQDRLRPILMTAMTTIVALLASVFDPSPSAESIKPMAVATIGGLTYATVLTLFFVPIMYDLMNRKNKLKSLKFDDDKADDIEADMNLAKVTELADVLTEEQLVESEKYIRSMNVSEVPTEENMAGNEENARSMRLPCEGLIEGVVGQMSPVHESGKVARCEADAVGKDRAIDEDYYVNEIMEYEKERTERKAAARVAKNIAKQEAMARKSEISAAKKEAALEAKKAKVADSLGVGGDTVEGEEFDGGQERSEVVKKSKPSKAKKVKERPENAKSSDEKFKD